MIPLSDETWQGLAWQEQLISAINDQAELMRHLGLNLPVEESSFPLKVPHAYVSRIEAGNPEDPLLRQILIDSAEYQSVTDYLDQPLEEEDYIPTKGLIQKYQSRALVVTTGACAIHCRYCFRRNFPYQDVQPSNEDWQQILDYLKAESEVHEILLSGGDPLVLSDKRLAKLISDLDEITHLDTLRIHSRLPLVIPDRITPSLVETLASSRLSIVLVNHINHAQEIDDKVITAMEKLKAVGTTLLNQSVLLKGVNDSAETLIKLSRRLFTAGILPYYLHLLDPVKGAAHFDIAQADAIDLMADLRNHLPGYLVPKLVREVPGEKSKVAIA